MKLENVELAWKLFVELRKEIIASQRIRAQVIGFKITFVTAGVGIIAANMDDFSTQLLVIPAFAAIFFDFLINSYSFSIKRIGYYCRTYIEPILKTTHNWPEGYPLWQEFMASPRVRQHFSFIGDLGITGLSLIVAIYGLFSPFRLISSLLWLSFLLLLFGYDIKAFQKVREISEDGF